MSRERGIQRGTITLTGTTGTATIPAIDTGHSRLRKQGQDGSSDQSNAAFVRLSVTDATTITGTRSNSSGTRIVSYEVQEEYARP